MPTLEDLKRHLNALVSTEQAASILHVSRRRVQQLAKERKLGIRIGRTLALTVKEVLYLRAARSLEETGDPSPF